MVIGTGTSLSVLEVVDAVRKVTGAELRYATRPAQAGRDAGGDRRSEPGAGSRLVAAVSRFAEGLAGVWEEWSKADARSIAAGRPGGAGDGRRQAVTIAPAKPFTLEDELGRLEPE